MGQWEDGREFVGACVAWCDRPMCMSHPFLYVSMCERDLYGHGFACLHLDCAHTCDLERQRSEGRRGLQGLRVSVCSLCVLVSMFVCVHDRGTYK
jgi:hypothetical protein